jgi:GH35 family endo-1,4-beta-xylanase
MQADNKGLYHRIEFGKTNIAIENVAVNGASQAVLEQQAQDFKHVFGICQQLDGWILVTVWGVSPEYSWIGKNNFAPGKVTSRFSSDHNPGIDLIHFFRF